MKDIQTGVDDRHAPTQPGVDPLERALWGLERVRDLATLSDDALLQARAGGYPVAVQQSAHLDYARAHALVSIAESLRTIARRSQP